MLLKFTKRNHTERTHTTCLSKPDFVIFCGAGDGSQSLMGFLALKETPDTTKPIKQLGMSRPLGKFLGNTVKFHKEVRIQLLLQLGAANPLAF